MRPYPAVVRTRALLPADSTIPAELPRSTTSPALILAVDALSDKSLRNTVRAWREPESSRILSGCSQPKLVESMQRGTQIPADSERDEGPSERTLRLLRKALASLSAAGVAPIAGSEQLSGRQAIQQGIAYAHRATNLPPAATVRTIWLRLVLAECRYSTGWGRTPRSARPLTKYCAASATSSRPITRTRMRIPLSPSRRTTLSEWPSTR
jgi:hypothetical protein